MAARVRRPSTIVVGTALALAVEKGDDDVGISLDEVMSLKLLQAKLLTWTAVPMKPGAIGSRELRAGLAGADLAPPNVIPLGYPSPKAFILCAPKLLLDMDWVTVPRGDDEAGSGPAIMSIGEGEDRGPLHGTPFITAFTRYQ